MASTFTIHVPGRDVSTEVHIGANLLHTLGEHVARLQPARILMVTDEIVMKLLGDRVMDSIRAAGLACDSALVFPPGEGSKSTATLQRVYKELGRIRMDRHGLILALGGGVVSDVAGFAAATWMRGIRYVTCPTTMEAMLDAGVGGKTGVNLPEGKNLVGAFHHPGLVLIDPATLTTLPPRDIRAGLAESIKHGLVFDPAFVEWHERHAARVLDLDAGLLTELIQRNLSIKGKVVTADPCEREGRRALLNFGHTIGHAIESACAYRLRHGECVSLGMVAACRISRELAGLEERAMSRALALLQAFGLPTRFLDAPEPGDMPDVDSILEHLKLDKKSRGAVNTFVLLADLGEPILRRGLPLESIRRATLELLQ